MFYNILSLALSHSVTTSTLWSSHAFFPLFLDFPNSSRLPTCPPTPVSRSIPQISMQWFPFYHLHLGSRATSAEKHLDNILAKFTPPVARALLCFMLCLLAPVLFAYPFTLCFLPLGSRCPEPLHRICVLSLLRHSCLGGYVTHSRHSASIH